jgi:hypothetical protein
VNTKSESRPLNALWALMDLGADNAMDEGWLFALAWLAAAKVTLDGGRGDGAQLEDLLSERHWLALAERGLPEDATKLVWRQSNLASGDRALASRALAIVAGLSEAIGSGAWDVLDAPWQIGGRQRSLATMPPALAPDLADALVAAVDAGRADHLWVPFDPTGQLTLRAARRGARVLASGPGQRSSLPVGLLLVLEGDSDLRHRVTLDRGDPRTTVREFAATHVLVAPPLGMRVSGSSEWAEWDLAPAPTSEDEMPARLRADSVTPGLDRADAWALSSFWPHARARGVFLVSPAALFAKGQEQRLREMLVWGHAGNPIRAIATLPSRLLGGASIAPAMLLLDRAQRWPAIRMIDLSEATAGGKPSVRTAQELDVQHLLGLLLAPGADLAQCVEVPVEALDALDLNLQPARYIKRVTNLPGPRAPLGELVDIVRAPVASKDLFAAPAWEVGIPHLDRWTPIAAPLAKGKDKSTSIDPRKAEGSVLRSGDVLLSIKGTIGKAGLLGDVPEAAPNLRFGSPLDADEDDGRNWPVVAAQSCIALRLTSSRMSPQLLLLYLRSEDFLRQVDGLRKGATVAHVTPSVLLKEVQVPLVPLADQAALIQTYDELCRLEDVIAAAELQTKALRESLWPLPVEAAR